MTADNNPAQKYFELLNRQKFIATDLDYDIFEKQIPFLNQMAQVKNSGITVFDLYKKDHIYHSYNLENLFGFDLSKIDTAYYNSRVHPDDLLWLVSIGTLVLERSYELPLAERKNYKLLNEYRILNAENNYLRIIEQFQVLELDPRGNFWLSLSTMDVSPNQEHYDGVRSQWVHLKTGKATAIDIPVQKQSEILSKREMEIFTFITEGLLSKEISNKLSISIHTVNTHRQNILKKLDANSSIEAIQYAKKLNLV